MIAAPVGTPTAPQSLAAAFETTHAPLLEQRPAASSDETPKPTALVEYQTAPLRFATEVLEVPEHTIRWSLNQEYAGHEWDGTRDPLLAILDALVASEDVGVESGTGTGKSFLGAIIVLWFLGCWDDARVFTFAPKEEQLRLYIWAELVSLWPKFHQRFPHAVLTDLRIRMVAGSDKWAAFGYAVGVKVGESSAIRAQGMHGAHMLLVYEETPGVPLPVIEAGLHTSTAPHNIRLALGNPDHQLDSLHLFAFDEKGVARPGVRHVRISALDHPNVVAGREIIPGAVSPKSIARREAGRMFESRVRGLSPKEAVDALIKLEWVQAAQKAWEAEMAKPLGARVYRLGKRALGVDVANSEDGDEGAIAEGQGPCLIKVESFPCPNANLLGFRVAQMVKDSHGGLNRLADAIEDHHVGVDTVGVGVGCYNEMLARDICARGLNGGASVEGMPSDTEASGQEEFRTLRAAMYWQMREDLRLGQIMLPPDVELARDLITPTWKPVGRAVVVESKEDIKKRTPGGKSPNKGDAAVYWNWVRDRTPIVEDIPEKYMTRAERLRKEFEEFDKQEREHEHDEPSAREKYGGTLRQ